MEESNIIENFFGVYLLYCINPKFRGRTYIGFTVDPSRRIKQHNTGVRAGGAFKTSNKGPWDMVLIIHGFPNDISALRFEWAWQNPHKSRRLRSLTHKRNKETKFEYCLRILSHMLHANPWCRLPLTIRWLKQEYYCDFPPGMEAPLHMPVAFGCVSATKISALEENKSNKVTKTICSLCKEEVCGDNFLRCPSPGCLMSSHIICLGNHMLGNAPSFMIPVEGPCPTCRTSLLWGDLVRLKKGCYQKDYFKADLDDDKHWTVSLSQVI